jgi:4-hydroxy-tetrahydrodipicolinate reductase
VKANTGWLLERGVHVVVGATGLTDEDLAELEARRRTGELPSSRRTSPIGAVLLMRLARRGGAKHLPHVEIIELHHDRKVDAPSGTALRTARLIAEARGEAVEAAGPGATRPAASSSTGSRSTACACPGSSPTRRSCSGAWARR